MANVKQIHKLGNLMVLIYDDGSRAFGAPTGRSKWLVGSVTAPGDPGTDPGPGTGEYRSPFGLEPGNDVTPDVGEFGPRSGVGLGSFHEGIDYGYNEANVTGTPIKAIGNGTVESIEYTNGHGNRIIVHHGTVTYNGQQYDLKSLYAHMYQPSPLSVGDSVTWNTTVGGVGQTSSSNIAVHLHMEIHMCAVGGGIIWNLNDDSNPRTAINPRDFFAAFGV